MLISKPKHTPYKPRSPPHCTPAIHYPIPAPTDGKLEKHAAHLAPKYSEQPE